MSKLLAERARLTNVIPVVVDGPQKHRAQRFAIRRVLGAHFFRDGLQLIHLRVAEVERRFHPSHVAEHHSAEAVAGIRVMAMEPLRLDEGKCREREHRDDRQNDNAAFTH